MAESSKSTQPECCWKRKGQFGKQGIKVDIMRNLQVERGVDNETLHGLERDESSSDLYELEYLPKGGSNNGLRTMGCWSIMRME